MSLLEFKFEFRNFYRFHERFKQFSFDFGLVQDLINMSCDQVQVQGSMFFQFKLKKGRFLRLKFAARIITNCCFFLSLRQIDYIKAVFFNKTVYFICRNKSQQYLKLCLFLRRFDLYFNHFQSYQMFQILLARIFALKVFKNSINCIPKKRFRSIFIENKKTIITNDSISMNQSICRLA